MATARKVTWTTPTGKKRVRWQYSLQVNGKQDQRMFETREECEAALQDRQKEIREGRIYGVVTRKFGQVVEEYLAYKRAKGKRSVEEDDEILNRKLVPFFGADTKMVDLKDSRIADYERAKAVEINPRTERTLTTSTVNRHLSVLRCLLRLAKKWGYVREVPQIEMGKEPEGRLRYLEKDEAIRLLDACRESKKNPYLHSIVTVALYTGMRKGEVFGLTWDRLDFSRGAILLEHTKSGKRREVPMSQAVHNVLSDLRKQQERVGEAPEGLVFRRANGARWGEINTAFSVALTKAGISNLRFHDLRHTFASWLIMDGATLVEVKELLGHHDITMTLRYAHLAPGRLREAVGRMDRLMEGAPGRTIPGEGFKSGSLPARAS